MAKENPQILVYITKNEKRVLGGDPLTLHMTDDQEIDNCIVDFIRALRANAVQLKNGDYIIISRD